MPTERPIGHPSKSRATYQGITKGEMNEAAQAVDTFYKTKRTRQDNFQGCTSKGVGANRSGVRFGATQLVVTEERDEHAIPARVCWSTLHVGSGISCHVTEQDRKTVILSLINLLDQSLYSTQITEFRHADCHR